MHSRAVSAKGPGMSADNATAPPSGAAMETFARCITEQLGLRVPPDRWPALAGLLDGAALHDWTGRPLQQAQVEALAERLAIGETYFFRDAAAFALIEQQVLPLLIEARQAQRRLRLWSAGCCTGEEAYSLAIVARRLLADPSPWDVEVLGTDIHPGFLARAEEGVYGDWSFRGVPPGLRERHFDPQGDKRWAVHADLKRWTRFAHLNLVAEQGVVGSFDLILCRHVLMYFDTEQARRVVAGLYRALQPGGWLLVGPSEAHPELFGDFETLHHGDTVIHRKPVAAPVHVQAAPTLASLATPVAAPPRDDRLEEAIRRCEASIAADKCDASLHYLHALLLEEACQPALARAALRRVLFLDRHFVPAHLALGRLCEGEGRSDLALRHVGHAQHALQDLAR
jgi:chemotaxis protein methyltransferase CheR